MRCSQAERYFSDHLDGLLGSADEVELQSHLRACRACGGEAERLRRSLGALEQLAVPSTPRDALWAGLQSRIRAAEAAGRQLSCRAATSQLPALLDGCLEGSSARSVAAHLEQCAACAAEQALLTRSLAALDRMPAAAPPPDLWDRIADRIHAERTRQPEWRSWLSWQQAGLAGGLAAAALALFLLVSREPAQEQGNGRYAVIPPGVARPSGPDPTSPAADAQVSGPEREPNRQEGAGGRRRAPAGTRMVRRAMHRTGWYRRGRGRSREAREITPDVPNLPSVPVPQPSVVIMTGDSKELRKFTQSLVEVGEALDQAPSLEGFFSGKTD